MVMIRNHWNTTAVWLIIKEGYKIYNFIYQLFIVGAQSGAVLKGELFIEFLCS